MYKVIAISGYSGSGKTTISEEILKNCNDLIYFDFGFLFRPVTYYLMNELKMTEDTIRTMVMSGELKKKIKLTFRVLDNKVEVGVNNNFYDYDILNSLKMNMDTVMVGSIIGDELNDELRVIIDDLKKSSNILLNARRPIVVYPDADCHIFLETDFDERVRRKMLMNDEDYETTVCKLMKRDQKEKSSGFWEKYDFTKTIDTTSLSKEEVLQKVLEIINNNFVYFNNLTLILGSYRCNKNCPYCIAKNNQKFSVCDNLERLDEILNELQENDIRFKRFVVSGNGEPSLYSLEDLRLIKESLLKYRDLFEIVRVHSSGNIFNEEDKFDIFGLADLPLEFEILRVALDSNVDMEVLEYNNNYLESPLFKRGNIKCDIALTDYLENTDLLFQLNHFLENNPSIKKVRLKRLLVGDNDTTIQAKWVKEHSLDNDEIQRVVKELGLTLENGIYQSEDRKILYKMSGDYDFDYVVNAGEFQNYENKKCHIKVLRRKLGG